MNNELPNFSLTQGYASGFASADFGDAEDNNPTGSFIEAFGGNQDAIQGIVQQSMARHLTEALPHSTSPQLGSFSTHTNNWRKRLREMMIRQNETVLSFLTRPTTEHPTIGPVEKILRRYSFRQDIDNNSIKTLKHLLDMSGNNAAQIQEEIETCILTHGSSTLVNIKKQFNALIEMYKETGEKLMDSENQLKMRIEKMDKIQKRVATIIELQTNDATTELTQALENYLKVSFRDMGIETQYKNIITLYQKHIAIRDAISVFKIGNQTTAEPLCPICISDSITTAISPCGHTFCSGCAKRMVNECGVCRGRIRDRLKLYFT
jgi:hypothetical protein